MRDRLYRPGKLSPALGLCLALLGASATLASEHDTMRVTERNLPEVLSSMVGAIEPGMRINDYTVVKQATASGKTFTTNYVVDIPDDQVNPADFREEDIRNEAKAMCANKSLQTLMKYGAIFERVYRAPGGTFLYAVKINRQRCQDLV